MTIARHLAFGRLTRVLELDQACPIPGAATAPGGGLRMDTW
jgi:hypothetical protein